MDSKDPHVLIFLEYVQQACMSYGIEILIANQKYFFAQGKKATAFFEHPTPLSPKGKIGIAKKCRSPHWIEQLIHEFGHFTQWKEQSALWLLDDAEHARIAKLGRPLERIRKEDRLRLFRARRDLELDCDRRALEIIKEWRLPIDTKRYAKRANAKILWYTHQIEAIAGGNTPSGRRGGDAHLISLYPQGFIEHLTPDFLGITKNEPA